MGIRRLALVQLFVAISFMAIAQKGTIKGLVTDKKTNEPLVGATVMLEGTTTGTITDFDGNYVVDKITPGTYTVRCSFISYETTRIENVSIQADKTIELNFEMGESTVEIEDVKVIGKANRESETMLLVEQKNAVLATQAIGAQEISRKGISNAEGAVTKVSGISKQEGVKNVFVRGLGDRFNSTSLNGFPVPSEDPEYKNISLDIFSSDMIQSVGVNKVFGAGMTGDVGGAGINIHSKELVGDSEFGVDVSVGMNDQTVTEDFQKLDGVNSFGFADKTPGPTDLSQYSFKNSLDPSEQSLQLNRSISVSGGKKLAIGAHKNPLSVYLLGSYTTDYSYLTGIVRNTTSTGTIFQDMTYDKFSQNTSHMGMVNADYNFKKNRLSFNGLYIHTNNQYTGKYFGKESEIFQSSPTESGLLRRQQINDNWVIVNQLLSNWELSKTWKLDAGLTYNLVLGNEPDRRMNYLTDMGNDQLVPTGSTGRQQRYFSDLTENDLNAKLAFNHDLSNGSSLKFGFTGRYVKRDFQAIEYDHSFTNPMTYSPNDVYLDAYFNQDNLGTSTSDYFSGKFLLDRNNDEYAVTKYINAGFGELVYQLNEKLVGIVGLRVEQVNLTVDYNVNRGGTIGSTKIDDLYLLPSLNFKYDVSEKSSVRLGASRSYTLPQDKEISPFRYVEVSFKSQGNPNLTSSLNYNFDLKYDYYLSSDELFSVTGFFKYIQNPISRVEVASAGGFLTYDNIADNATIAGFEMELRKNILKSVDTGSDQVNKLSAGVNTSYILTDVKLEDATFTNDKSQLEGAAPMILNADLTYQYSKKDFSLTNSLVVNYFSDRIYTIGTLGYQDINEDGITTLDFVSSVKLNEHWGLSLKGKNLLDPSFRLTRKPNGSGSNIILSDYKKGINVTFGISYNL